MVGNKDRLFLWALLQQGFNQLNLAHTRDVAIKKNSTFHLASVMIFTHLGKKKQGHVFLNQVVALLKCNVEKPVAVLLYLENKIKIKAEEELFQL